MWAVLSGGFWGLGRTTDKETEEAQKAVAAALKQLPVGADERAFDQAKSKALEPFERVARERKAAEDLGQRAVSLLRAYLSSEYEWDSFSEEAETFRELAAELPAVIQRAYRAGHVDADNLQQFVEDWTDERLADEED
jgi:hypothetical protein